MVSKITKIKRSVNLKDTIFKMTHKLNPKTTALKLVH